MKIWAVVAIGIGGLILFAGDSLANIGQSVDNLIANKWVGVALVGFGVIILGVESKAFAKL